MCQNKYGHGLYEPRCINCLFYSFLEGGIYMDTEKRETSDQLFATQSHVMTEDLLNALDLMISVNESSTDEMSVWFLEFIKNVDVDEEFTVTASQAQWLIQSAQDTQGSTVIEIPEDEDTSDLDLIFATFDDYENFLRVADSDQDIFRIVIKDN